MHLRRMAYAREQLQQLTPLTGTSPAVLDDARLHPPVRPKFLLLSRFEKRLIHDLTPSSHRSLPRAVCYTQNVRCQNPDAFDMRITEKQASQIKRAGELVFGAGT